MEQYVLYAQDPLRKWIMIRITDPMNESDILSISENLVNYIVKKV